MGFRSRKRTRRLFQYLNMITSLQVYPPPPLSPPHKYTYKSSRYMLTLEEQSGDKFYEATLRIPGDFNIRESGIRALNLIL